MRNKYKLPLHIKNYIKTELYDYKKNKKIIFELEKDNNIRRTRTILLTLQRINKIDQVLNNLPKEDKNMAEKIFFERHNQVYMETNHYISKETYYNTMNKIIYLVAIEFELI